MPRLKKPQADQLYELADLIHAVARRLPAPAGLWPGPCTPVEISVVRFVGANPGTSATAAARATQLLPSNFSRVLKGLVERGLIRREVDQRDARSTRLYPTALAKANKEKMRDAWSRALGCAAPDMANVELINAALRHIEEGLASDPSPASEAPASNVSSSTSAPKGLHHVL